MKQPRMHFLQGIRRLGLPSVASFGYSEKESTATLAGAVLLTTANVLSWFGGLLPIRNPFFALRSHPRLRILPKLGFYTLYAIVVNLLSLAASFDDIFNGPGPRNSPPSDIKSTFLSTLDHLFHAALFATRFYFVYRSRALLRLYGKVMELSASTFSALRAGRPQTTPNRAVFRLPPLIFGFLLLRIGIRTLLEVRYTTNVLLHSSPNETTCLQELMPACVECQWTLHSMLIAFPYFLTAVMPVHFAISILMPLTDIFQDFYDEVVKTPSSPSPRPDTQEQKNLRQQKLQAIKINYFSNKTSFVTVPTLVSRFEDIGACFTEFSRIFGPMLLFLTMIAVMNTINFISSLSVSHLSTFDNLIVIVWELSTLCFIELGAWAHAKVEDSQDTLRNLLIMPKSRMPEAHAGAKACTVDALADPERNAVAQMICNWKWKINAGRGFFVIDRTLYATILSFMVSYSIVLLQLDLTPSSPPPSGTETSVTCETNLSYETYRI